MWTDISTIHQMKNSSFLYVKHVLLDTCMKGWLESNKCLLFSKSQTPFLVKKCSSLHFYKKKKISTKIFSKFVTIIVYKDNLKPLSLFDVIF